MTVVESAVRISLEDECGCEGSISLGWPLYRQLATGKYDVCSVLELQADLNYWRLNHRTARKRADRAERLGYRFDEIESHRYVDDIYAINTSMAERQGRPMSAGYNKRPSASPDPVYACPRHVIRRYGVLSGQRLVAYLWLYRAGDLALVSSILGHGEYLDDGIMFLLIQGAIEAELAQGGFMVYNRHDSGEDGLRWFKERCGFQAMEVAWAA